MMILGISAYYHDSAAALLEDGKVLAAVQEERLSRRKHDARFPRNAIAWCLSHANVSMTDIEYVVFYDKPWIKFERMLETYLAFAPKGLKSFLTSMPLWLKDKLNLKSVLQRELAGVGGCHRSQLPRLLFTEHHEAHAASAFFASPFERAAVLCLDGVGEWATTSLWLGTGNQLIPQWEIDFPHSLGLLYSAFTYYTGFKVNSGEYKLMGLAPYGEPRYVDKILTHLIDIKSDGSFRLNLDYFNYTTGLTMTSVEFEELFGGPARAPESPLTQREMDLARSIQVVTEEVILRLARTARRELSAECLCMAGGVALNCVANGRILRENLFRDIWVQPAAGDAGGALGAALAAWHGYAGRPRLSAEGDLMRGSFLGPAFDSDYVGHFLQQASAPFQYMNDEVLFITVAELLSRGAVVGWFQGRMEFGPRALGNRSIIGDPRNPHMQSLMNLKIKFRESFRPFAPAVRFERARDYFALDRPSPYMALVAPICEELRVPLRDEHQQLFGIEMLKVPRSTIPAVTHVDYSARVQTVHEETNPRFYRLLEHFEALTGCAVLVNTSFNVRGEPIVCSPAEAYRCFMRTGIDYLVLENFLLDKKEQPAITVDESWRREIEPD
ncbi:MAG: carbamoyltransferase [Deltaproteobacteria bacterium]|nr:carbamoyltransferase [Deltaproteobacteria bacterium]